MVSVHRDEKKYLNLTIRYKKFRSKSFLKIPYRFQHASSYSRKTTAFSPFSVLLTENIFREETERIRFLTKFRIINKIYNPTFWNQKESFRVWRKKCFIRVLFLNTFLCIPNVILELCTFPKKQQSLCL